jgi:hypothetical protein
MIASAARSFHYRFALGNTIQMPTDFRSLWNSYEAEEAEWLILAVEDHA